MVVGSIKDYFAMANSEYRREQYGRQTSGANVRCREGNNPDRQLRSQIIIKWKTKWEGRNNQDVGLEAATI
jgi:hypothetical protein